MKPPTSRGRRPPVPAGVGAGGRDAHPRRSATSTSPRRPCRRRSRSALERWPRDGMPDNPGAWITHDGAQPRDRPAPPRARGCATKTEALRDASPSSRRWATDDDATIPDDRLRLIFTCCHPALPLRGAGRADAAHARRADHRGDRAGVPRRRADDGAAAGPREAQDPRRRRSPTACRRAELLAERLDGVLAVLYLIFNEGYAATDGDARARASCATRRSGWRACWSS